MNDTKTDKQTFDELMTDWRDRGFTEAMQLGASRWQMQAAPSDQLWPGGLPHEERIRFMVVAFHPDGNIEAVISARWRDDSAITLPLIHKVFESEDALTAFCALWGIEIGNRGPFEDIASWD